MAPAQEVSPLTPQDEPGQPAQNQLPSVLGTPDAPVDPMQRVDTTLATLHGVVRNAITGEGVARALVRIEGDAEAGALTGSDGRFEIPGVPVGPQAVEVLKPAFLDASSHDQGAENGAGSGPAHNVLVAAEMPDVVFTLAPTCAIRGRVDLSTGDAADGIEVGLVRRTVMDGRAIWQLSGFTKTKSDGTYRFGGLPDGQYEVYTAPALDSEPVSTLVAPGQGNAAERWGYASVFYPSARDPSGAQVIPVANGGEAEANFLLTREPFETVTANVAAPQTARGWMSYSAQVMDGAGHELPYPVQYDRNTQSIQAALPDGSYSMLVSSNGLPAGMERAELGRARVPSVLVGSADFAVADHAVTELRIPLSVSASSSINVNVNRSGTGNPQTQDTQIAVMVSQAGGWTGGGIVGQFAGGTVAAPLETQYEAPGPYWVHTSFSGQGVCEASFTAGGANLAREPLVIGISGATAPMELTLRDDCAALTVSLPESAMTFAAGDELFYTVYAVPDFDFTRDLDPVVLRPSTQGSFTLNGLTPGNYHVYTFEGDVRLEYRNPAVLAAFPNPGQAVTLSPGTTGTLVLEIPAQ